MVIVAASGNKDKLREMEVITAPFGMHIITREEAGVPVREILEDGDTFEENSYKKALAVMELSGEAAIADDSGLEVDALGGAPGVYSARFAGEHDDRKNNEKLLDMMEDIPAEERTARFVCVITLMYPDGRCLTARGECPGRILMAPRGESGFGYDPLFTPEGRDQSFGELPAEEKNKISHRGLALRRLHELLEGND